METDELTFAVLKMLKLMVYIVFDSFTSQWQSRVYREHPKVDQFQMMFVVNAWSIILTMGALVVGMCAMLFRRRPPSGTRSGARSRMRPALPRAAGLVEPASGLRLARGHRLRHGAMRRAFGLLPGLELAREGSLGFVASPRRPRRCARASSRT